MFLNYIAILKKEMYSYFVSPVFYGVIVVFLILSGYFFYTDLSLYNMLNVRGAADPIEGFFRRYFGDLRFLFMLLMPLITMRLYAEEKKLGTFELLTVSPTKDIDILLSKFSAGLLIFTLLLFLTIPNICILVWVWNIHALEPLLPAILTGYIGLFFFGCALLSCGLFVSSLTENQSVAGMITLGIFVFFWFITWNEVALDNLYLQFLMHISLFDRMQDFFQGILSISDLTYFILFTLLFILLTYYTQCSRMWR